MTIHHTIVELRCDRCGATEDYDHAEEVIERFKLRNEGWRLALFGDLCPDCNKTEKE